MSTLHADCSLVTLKPAHSSRLLPIGLTFGRNPDLANLSEHSGQFLLTWLLCCSRQFTTIDGRKPLQKRLAHRLMVVLLTIRVNCSCWRAKPAHFVGHLPPERWLAQIVQWQRERTACTRLALGIAPNGGDSLDGQRVRSHCDVPARAPIRPIPSRQGCWHRPGRNPY